MSCAKYMKKVVDQAEDFITMLYSGMDEDQILTVLDNTGDDMEELYDLLDIDLDLLYNDDFLSNLQELVEGNIDVWKNCIQQEPKDEG